MGVRFAICALALAVLALGFAVPAAQAQDRVVVPTRVIYPGEMVTADSLRSVAFERGKRNLPPLVFQAAEADGKIATRTLLPGRLIAASSLREAYAVEAGKPVEVQFVQGGLTISATGIPLQAGLAGDLIRVRNADSGIVFNGTVMADGTVRVGAT